MSLTSRFGRRLAAGIGLASAAILLPAAALAASDAAGTSAGTSGAAARALPACVAAHTRVWYGLPADHATGHTFYELEFSNVGRSACTFFGFPGVSAVDSRGRQLGKPATHFGHRIAVTLRAHETAHVILVVVSAINFCAHPVSATQIKVFPPGQFRSQFVPLVTLACRGKSVLSVDSVHQGTGIPFFSIR